MTVSSNNLPLLRFPAKLVKRGANISSWSRFRAFLVYSHELSKVGFPGEGKGDTFLSSVIWRVVGGCAEGEGGEWTKEHGQEDQVVGD